MTSKDLKPVSELANKAGCKILFYGAPGTGKTPTLVTAWNPCICSIETGLKSVKDHTGPGFVARTIKDIEGYINWACDSSESVNYTHCLDSASHMCKIYLDEKKGGKQHGLQIYGAMADWASDLLTRIDRSNRLWAITAKEEELKGENQFGTRPAFPGQVLLIDTPHLFDFVFRLEYVNVNGVYHRVFRTRDELGIHKVRARSNKLEPLEPANIQQVMQKGDS